MSKVVYLLCDPRDNRPRYVGVTDNLKERFYNHLKDKARNHRTNWIKSLSRLNLVPFAVTLESDCKGDWRNSEKYWIRLFIDLGANLVNATEGGDGCEGYHHKRSVKQSFSKRMMGNKIGIGNKNTLGRKLSGDHKAKVSASLIGNHRTLGKKLPPFTTEHKSKISLGQMGNKRALGYVKSEESKNKIRAARLKYWAERRVNE
jgi:predicted GIY-YIG superfamily endonuclease